MFDESRSTHCRWKAVDYSLPYNVKSFTQFTFETYPDLHASNYIGTGLHASNCIGTVVDYLTILKDLAVIKVFPTP